MSTSDRNETRPAVVVVGGGLAGLVAANHAARAGARVTLLDAREELGGRARTHRVGDALLNEGAHALYLSGGGFDVLTELGVEPTGGPPALPVRLHRDGQDLVLPSRARDAVARPAVPLRAVARIGALLLAGRGPATADLSMSEWIRAATSDPDARSALRVLTRVATYCDDLDDLAAGPAVHQLRIAARPGVRYLDGGWGRLVDGLLAIAEREGVKVCSGTKVESLRVVGMAVEVRTDDATPAQDATMVADAVVIATGGPTTTARLLDEGGTPSAAARQWADEAHPVRATTIDLHLARLPRPEIRVCFPVDAPLYFSVHSSAADLAGRGEVVHLLKYGAGDGSAAVAEIEAFADEVQPGWRQEVLARRVGRSLVVAHDRPRPGTTLADRPGPEVPDAPNVFVAGDWVGPTGLLADAALTSGRDAGTAAAATGARHPTRTATGS
jgi:phytoene dehydrogenase-like protein